MNSQKLDQQIKRKKNRSADQALEQPMTNYIKEYNRLKVRSTDKKLQQHITSQSNREKLDQNLDQQIKNQINRYKVRSTDTKLDQQIKSQIK